MTRQRAQYLRRAIPRARAKEVEGATAVGEPVYRGPVDGMPQLHRYVVPVEVPDSFAPAAR